MNDFSSPDLFEAFPLLSEDVERLKNLNQEISESEPERSVEIADQLNHKTVRAQSAWDALHGLELERRPGQSFLGFVGKNLPSGELGVEDVTGKMGQILSSSPGIQNLDGEPVEHFRVQIMNSFGEIRSLQTWLDDQLVQLLREDQEDPLES